MIPPKNKELKTMGSYGTVGLEIVLSILLGLFIGTRLDDWLGTKPWMAVLWFGFGCAAAGRSVYRTWKSMQAVAKREEEQEGNPAQAFPDEKSLAWQREEARRAEEERRAAEGVVPAADEESLETGADGATKKGSKDAAENGASR